MYFCKDFYTAAEREKVHKFPRYDDEGTEAIFCTSVVNNTHF